MRFNELQTIARELRGEPVSPDPRTVAYRFLDSEDEVAFLARLRQAGVPAAFWGDAIAVSVAVLS